MDRGISLHMGVWSPTRCRNLPTLDGPRSDPYKMAEIAAEQHFEASTVLPGDAATRDAMHAHICSAACSLGEHDTFLITFSGHGRTSTRLPTIQTWCLADHELSEDELFQELAAFAEGVRVIVVSASCHSGGLGHKPIDRFITKCVRFFMEMLGFHAPHEQSGLVRVDPPNAAEIKASVLYLSSCRDDENSLDGKQLTLFTEVLAEFWDHGRYPGTYEQFIQDIRVEVTKRNSKQTPAASFAGVSPEWYRSEHPFTIRHATPTPIGSRITRV